MGAKLVRFSEKGNMVGDENKIFVPQRMMRVGDDSLPVTIQPKRNHRVAVTQIEVPLW